MDLEGVTVLDVRRLAVVADDLLLWHGAQLAIDTTLVSPLHRDGTARRTAADRNEAALKQARCLKETTDPELSEEGARARLVVPAAEVRERWSEETAHQTAPLILQNRVKAAWLRRCSNVLACSAAFALSLLDKHPNPGTVAEVLQVHEVLGDYRFA